MSRKKVLVLGGNFAGLTAALAVRHELHGDVDVRVVSASDEFLFNPSLIWLPFGKRSPADITFPLAPTFESHGVDFAHAEATALDLAGRKVTTSAGVYDYDYLVIATGYRNNFAVAPGLGPGGNAYTITTLEDAVRAGEGWRRFLEAPGDIVVGATQGAGCFGAAYEYLFNVSHQLRKAGLKRQVFLSPHKFPGGPQTPGVLIVRRELVRNQVPTAPGGGTVAFVDPVGHRYLDDPVAREEGGTPAIIESIRAGLVVALKQAVGTGLITAREEQLWRHVLRRWSAVPQIEVLGNQQSRRLSIASFRIRHRTHYLHHNFVVAVLNDLFGIQARGGCSCAGPYGHRLLAIGAARSHALREEIGHGCDGIKPGWSRVNLNYFISAAQADYIAAAVELLAVDGYRLLPSYRFDPRTALWRHASAPPRPALTLGEVSYGPDGEMTYPHRRGQAGEDVFPGYLRHAQELLAGLPARLRSGPAGLSPEFEALRWFPLPPGCLSDVPSEPAEAAAG